jgi:ATP-dependent 26S proteasome regulatory subunit
MKLPSTEARAQILGRHVAELPEEVRQVDINALAVATESFTGADIRRLMEDGKAMCAYDKSRRAEMGPATGYFLQAVEGVRENKKRFAEAEAQASAKAQPHGTPFNSFAFRQALASESD